MEQIQILEYRGIRVVTTKQIAEMYGTDSKVVSKNFNRNKERYIEGKHYFFLTGEELKSFRQNDENTSKAPRLYLWTERGALLLAKSINTDVAWAAYERLVDFYFEKKEESTVPAEQPPKDTPKTKYQTSNTLVPKNPSWYERNRRRLNAICDKIVIPIETIYHIILLRLGEEYDLDAANKIYEDELGKPPKHAIDIVNYFPQLARMADDYLVIIEEIVK